MITRISEMIYEWMGWCPNTPALRTAPAILVVPPVTVNPAQPGSGGAAGSQDRIRHGIGIATGSIKTLFREKHLLWFSLLAGLAILFLIMAEGWSVTHYAFIPLPYSVWIPFGDSSLIVFNMQLFLIEAICLSGFTYLLAGLILYRIRSRAKKPVTIREGFDGINAHTGTLAALSIAMALVATILLEITSQSQITGKIEFALSMAMFYLPYAYYITPNGIFSALFFSFRIMVANSVLFLLALYVVPVIVLENKRLIPAIARSARLMKKTWRELLGCVLVFGAIVLIVAAVALLIGQSPVLLNHDYDFFLQMSRGQVLMTGICYGFLLACGVLMAAGSTVMGIAITDLYACGSDGTVHRITESDSLPVAEPVR